MKKKFDFSAEMSETETIKATPKNEYLEEENRLLDINVQELAKLNDNVFKLRTAVENLSGSIRECKPIISEEMQKLAVEFGTRLLCDFLSQIESKCKEAERRMKKSGNAIHIPANTFYIFFFRQHDSGKHRNTAFKFDLESCFHLCPHYNYRNYHGDSCIENFRQIETNEKSQLDRITNRLRLYFCIVVNCSKPYSPVTSYLPSDLNILAIQRFFCSIFG